MSYKSQETKNLFSCKHFYITSGLRHTFSIPSIQWQCQLIRQIRYAYQCSYPTNYRLSIHSRPSIIPFSMEIKTYLWNKTKPSTTQPLTESFDSILRIQIHLGSIPTTLQVILGTADWMKSGCLWNYGLHLVPMEEHSCSAFVLPLPSSSCQHSAMCTNRWPAAATQNGLAISCASLSLARAAGVWAVSPRIPIGKTGNQRDRMKLGWLHTLFSSEAGNLAISIRHWDAVWCFFSGNTSDWQSYQKIHLSKMSWYNYFSLGHICFWKLTHTINSRERK